MSKVEDILYQAYNEGIRDEVFTESNKLDNRGGKYDNMEIGDKFEIAYNNVIEKRNKNGKSKRDKH